MYDLILKPVGLAVLSAVHPPSRVEVVEVDVAVYLLHLLPMPDGEGLNKTNFVI